MNIVSIESQGLVVTQGHQVPVEMFSELISNYEYQLFEEGYYKNGPTMAEFKISDFKKELLDVTIYIPVNAPVEEGENHKWIDHLKLESCLRKRTPFDESTEAALEEMKAYIDQEGLVYEDRLILVFLRVFDEYWVDLLIPVKE